MRSRDSVDNVIYSYRIFWHIRHFFHLKICLKNGVRAIHRCILYAEKYGEDDDFCGFEDED
jgi:hypothetical protein